MQLNEVKPYKHKMKIETLICFLVGSLIFTPGLSANPDLPELKFTDYTVENGLSYNSVLSICQDASGKMYFGGTDTVKPAWYRSTATRIIFAILVLGATHRDGKGQGNRTNYENLRRKGAENETGNVRGFFIQPEVT